MKYQIRVSTDTYWNYVVEADSEEEARERARIDFRESFDSLVIDVEATEVPNDTPLGDN